MKIDSVLVGYGPYGKREKHVVPRITYSSPGTVDDSIFDKSYHQRMFEQSVVAHVNSPSETRRTEYPNLHDAAKQELADVWDYEMWKPERIIALSYQAIPDIAHEILLVSEVEELRQKFLNMTTQIMFASRGRCAQPHLTSFNTL